MPNHSTISTAQYRVQISPHFDLWMRGAKYGTVVREYVSPKTGERMVAVQMDHPQVRKLFRCKSSDVAEV